MKRVPAEVGQAFVSHVGYDVADTCCLSTDHPSNLGLNITTLTSLKQSPGYSITLMLQHCSFQYFGNKWHSTDYPSEMILNITRPTDASQHYESKRYRDSLQITTILFLLSSQLHSKTTTSK